MSRTFLLTEEIGFLISHTAIINNPNQYEDTCFEETHETTFHRLNFETFSMKIL